MLNHHKAEATTQCVIIYEDMIHDIGPESFQRATVYDSFYSDVEKPLYTRCTNFTRLSVVLRLLNLKAKNG
ncbi:hypothetical protein CR513_06451, partial [Mucuna pruriens]